MVPKTGFVIVHFDKLLGGRQLEGRIDIIQFLRCHKAPYNPVGLVAKRMTTSKFVQSLELDRQVK
jgi:hypothetical protein